MDAIKQAQAWIKDAQHIVFFGGAGTSTQSGIPDFRSDTGLYSDAGSLSPEYALSHVFATADPDAFAEFYKQKLIYPDAKPTRLHEVLVQWEQEGKLSAVITQNIDRLHQKAGSEHVIELHGNLWDHYCASCGARYELSYALNFPSAAKCEKCGGVVRPDVTLYGEMLPEGATESAIEAIRAADVLIVAGTSLVVYPAAGLIRYYSGDKLILINRQDTPIDGRANLYFREDIGTVLDRIAEEA